MNHFSQELVKIKLEAHFKTSKSFFNYLKSGGLDCNYQYYIKIESGVSFPSSQIINQIAKVLEREYAERIIRAYCMDQFMAFDYLFQNKVIDGFSNAPSITHSQHNNNKINQGQRELTLNQVETLKSKKENYFLFLILTLSRYPLDLTELSSYSKLKKSIPHLVNSSIASLEENILKASSSEFVFPKESENQLETTYALFDQWDFEFSGQFEFKKYLNKMMIRRISPRYFGVIQKQIDTLTDFVRCSDESDRRHNNEVLHLHISLSKGQLPG